MSTPTTRRHPRTLREAFPRDPEHAYAIQRCSRAGSSVLATLAAWCCVVGMSVLLGIAVVF